MTAAPEEVEKGFREELLCGMKVSIATWSTEAFHL